MTAPSLILFRRDLRIEDNPALHAAMRAGPAIALFVLDDMADGRPLGGAARWWLHHALTRLQCRLDDLGVPLILRRGRQNEHVIDIAAAVRADSVLWNRRYTPSGIAIDSELKAALKDHAIRAESFPAAYLREPWEVQTKQGGWFKVFTPFWKASLALGEPTSPARKPKRQSRPNVDAASDRLHHWGLLPTKPDWAGGLRNTWPAETGSGERRLQRFLEEAVGDYADARNRPDLNGTSALSPYLAFGELSPRQVWHATRHAQDADHRAAKGAEAFLRELVWRDFCANLLYHFPTLGEEPFQEKFQDFPWIDDAGALKAWQRGRTGYPWIDAGMRQLWDTGWMHNRVRMGVASFFTKHLLLDWRAGEAWFWDTLVDADPAQNIANWQWVAGSGADAAPYFRIFNPITQGDKFDPQGDYRRRWLPKAESYAPGAAAIKPIVQHKPARERALAAYQSLSD
jgi:deoxyribodipyrimidine photo-lyase